MLYAYSINEQAVAANAPVAFNVISVSRDCPQLRSDDNTAVFSCSGVYEISFNGTATTAGSVQLQLNNVLVGGALSTGTSLAFTSLITIKPNCYVNIDNLPSRIQIVNTGGATLTLSNAALTVTKVG